MCYVRESSNINIQHICCAIDIRRKTNTYNTCGATEFKESKAYEYAQHTLSVAIFLVFFSFGFLYFRSHFFFRRKGRKLTLPTYYNKIMQIKLKLIVNRFGCEKTIQNNDLIYFYKWLEHIVCLAHSHTRCFHPHSLSRTVRSKINKSKNNNNNAIHLNTCVHFQT